MPKPHQPPTDATIEAWLAGELSHEEAAGLEAYFAENPPEESAVPPALREAAQSEVPDPALTPLLEKVSAIDTRALPPVRADAWKEILTPCEEEGILGLLGHYQVQEIVAQGGMGLVFRAYDPELKRTVALKALSPDLASNATARTRFLREARAAAALEHDHILPLYSVHNDPSPWFAMRYVSGGTLQDTLDRNEDFPLTRLKSITLQTCSALAAAHKAGIVHRDIKPANIMLDEDGERLWLGDFGIARSIADPSLTYAGNVAGTPLYMSPEQAAGVLLDGRSDLFSLGSVLYHCATGQSPFAGKTSAAVLKKLSQATHVRPRSLNGKLPTWFERLLEKLLQKEPTDRFPDAQAVIAALQSERVALSAKKKRVRSLLTVIGAALLIVTLLLQLAPVKNLTNRGLLALTGHSFTVRDRLGTRASLTDAIAAARASDVILIHGNEALPIDLVKIPANKPLTLRAAKGSNPILANTGANAHLEARAPVRLVGLTFRPQKIAKTSPGCLVLLGPKNLLRDCTFEATSYPTNPNSAGRPAVIKLGSLASVRVEGCRFRLKEVAAVALWDQRPEAPDLKPNRIEFIDTFLTGSRAVTLIRVDSSVGSRVSFEGCLVATDCVVMDYWNQKLKPLRIRSQATCFAPQHAMLWVAAESSQTVAPLVTWSSENDLFRQEVPFFSNALVLPKPKKRATLLIGAEWQQLSQTKTSGSVTCQFAPPLQSAELETWEKALSKEVPTEVLKAVRKVTEKE